MTLIQDYKNTVRLLNIFKKFENNEEEIREIEHDIQLLLTEMCSDMPAGVCRICYKLQHFVLQDRKSYIYCEPCQKCICEFSFW